MVRYLVAREEKSRYVGCSAGRWDSQLPPQDALQTQSDSDLISMQLINFQVLSSFAEDATSRTDHMYRSRALKNPCYPLKKCLHPDSTKTFPKGS